MYIVEATALTIESCKDCPYRSIEPNCHNVEYCEGWRIRKEKEMQLKDVRYRSTHDPAKAHLIETAERIQRAKRNHRGKGSRK